MSKRTIESLKKEVEDLTNGEYIILSTEYHNNKEKLLFKHNIPECGNEFLMSPHCFLHQNQRCPKEKYTRRVNPQQYSFEDVQKKVKEISNDEYSIEEYTKVAEKAKFTHNCGNTFYMTVNHFFSGNRCPKCSHQRANKERLGKSIEYYQEILNRKQPDKFIIVTKEYTNCMDKNTEVLCKSCNKIFKTSLNNLINKMHCPQCEYLEKKNKVESLLKNTNFSILEDEETIIKKWTKPKHNIKVRCNKCGSNIKLNSRILIDSEGKCRCPICNEYASERLIANILEQYKFNIVKQKTFEGCSNKRKLRFDFFIEDLNLLIEYDGEFHYLPVFGDKILENQKLCDSIKNEYSKEKKINLLRIPYWEKEQIPEILMEIKNMKKEYNENYNLDIRKNLLN